MSNITRTSLDALSQSNFPDNTTQQISPADLRAWIESAVDSFVTQKDTSTFENAFYECKSSTIIVAGIGSCNLVAATGNFVHITSSGSATITSFGNLPAGSRFILNFEVPITLQYNATTLILPGAADIITAAGDSVLIVSEGSGNWRLIGYFPAAGLPVGTVTAVTASAPLSSTGGNAPNISITQANGTTDGFLDSADWATFNGKQDALSAGTGISLAGNTVTNTAPDQTVALTAGTGINVTGTYPSFTIAATGGGGGSGTVTSVDLTMPSAFSVSGNPITTSGTLAVTGAGLASQYVRGDGTLANFPEVTGGGSSVSYYLNGSVTQLTISGDTYYQMSKTPIFGAGTNFTRTNGSGNGYIASFITDAGDPNILSIPGGNFNIEFYLNASSGGGSPQFYAELYKYDGATLTLIASGSTNPEGITNGTTVDSYFTTLGVPTTALALTDRLAVRIYVITSGRDITLHTEDNNLCQVITTISTGLTALNGLTAQVQTFATGTSGTDFAISSVTNTHTFNIPDASDTARGLITTGNQTLAGIKTFGNGASAGEVRLLEPSGSGTNYVAVKAQAMASDYSLTLPTTAGSSGQVLITDGSGGLSWTSNGGTITTQYIKNFTTGTVTGTTAATVAHSILISANTFTAGQAFRIENRTSRTAGATASTVVALYINTSIAVGGTLIGQWSMGSGVAGGIMTRGIAITSATTSIYNSTSAIADYSVTGINTANIDWTLNQYLIVAYTNPSTTTVTNSLATNIYPI